MSWKETVLKNEVYLRNFAGTYRFSTVIDAVNEARLAQAEHTWDIAFKAGIKKVVEYIGKPFEHHYRWFMTEEQSEYRHDKEDCFACKYEAQLKEWGIDKEAKSGNK